MKQSQNPLSSPPCLLLVSSRPVYSPFILSSLVSSRLLFPVLSSYLCLLLSHLLYAPFVSLPLISSLLPSHRFLSRLPSSTLHLSHFLPLSFRSSCFISSHLSSPPLPFTLLSSSALSGKGSSTSTQSRWKQTASSATPPHPSSIPMGSRTAETASYRGPLNSTSYTL